MRKFKKYFKEYIKNKGLYEIWFVLRNLPLVIAKYLNVIIMIFVFFISPSNLYRFSWRGFLPKPKMRDKSKNLLEDLYQPSISKNFDIDMSNKSLYTRGFASKIKKYDENAILINFRVSLENRNSIFTTSDIGMLKHYLDNNVDVIFVETEVENDHGITTHLGKKADNFVKLDKKLKVLKLKLKTNLSGNLSLTSGIVSIISFFFISKKLSVYGWNYYQKKNLYSMNIFEFVFKIFFSLLDINTLKEVENTLTHLYFAYFFKDIKDLNIIGYLNYYENNYLDKVITKRLKAIFLKD